MGFWSRVLGIDSVDAAQRVLSEPYEPFLSTGGIPVMDPGSPVQWWAGSARTEIEGFWRTQPNLRKVVDFVSRNVATIPLQAFERQGDVERLRINDGPLAGLLRLPAPRRGSYRFWHQVLSDGLLYDRWLVLLETRADGGYSLTHVPSWRLWFKTNPLGEVTKVLVWTGDRDLDAEPGDQDWEEVDLDRAILDYGYAPRTAGLSPVETLKSVLEELSEAVEYRRGVWENGARMPGYISRPEDAPVWNSEQRNRFVTALRSHYAKNGPRAGGLPLLEDGMRIESTDVFSPQDALDLEGRRLSAIEVASAFHIAPELVGAQQGNYSNVREYRQMLYRDSLGPYIKAWEEAVNTQLVPLLTSDPVVYVEANIESKLRGSFEEQASIMQSATGAPWVTRNEARAMQNRPPVGGGDELVVPLNVLTGGQASPNDADPTIERSGQLQFKADQDKDPRLVRIHQELSKFFDAQERSVLTRRGLKADGAITWWDDDHWNSELADLLFALSHTYSTAEALATIRRFGFADSDFSAEQTLAYLKTIAASDAQRINEATLEKVKAAQTGDDVRSVYEASRSSRGWVIAATVLTAAVSFGVKEAAEQAAGHKARKTWIVTSKNPRPSHAALDGVTVGVAEVFPNGLKWPGDGSNVDEIAGCTCRIEVEVPEGQT